MIRIRPFKPSDEERVLSFCRDGNTWYDWTAGVLGEWPAGPEHFHRTEELARFTALEETTPVGFFTARNPGESADELRFGFVILDPEKRGRGLGRAMISSGLDYAFLVYQAERVTLGVFSDNLPAYFCYKAAGFRETGLRERYTVRGRERIALEMECLREDR